MSTVNTLGSALWQTRDHTISDPLTDSGLAAPLGFRTKLAANEHDKLLFVLTVATGAVAGGEAFTRSTTYKEAAAGTYEDYTVPGNTGDQEWVYVANESGGDIARGTPLKYNTASTMGAYSVVAMGAGDHPDECIGVAQFVIPDGQAGFAASGGWGEVTIGGAGTTEGEAVEFGTTGGALDANPASLLATNGRAYTTAAAGRAEVILSLRK